MARGICNGEFYNLCLEREGECCNAVKGETNCWCWLIDVVRAEWLDVFVEWEQHCLLLKFNLFINNECQLYNYQKPIYKLLTKFFFFYNKKSKSAFSVRTILLN